MATKPIAYEKALAWCADAGGKCHVLLGNGFSMAYDPHAFGYQGLAEHAEAQSHLSSGALRLMKSLGTTDFEAAMRAIRATIVTLRALGPTDHRNTLARLEAVEEEIREALAQSVAGLHPERPYEIDERCYLSVRRFLRPFDHIYSANYDLLLYWALMQDITDGAMRYPSRAHDDGFRDSGVEGDDTVLWDIYDTFKQTVYYLHGALHLYLGLDGLRKLTWSRTGEPLVDQVREQLSIHRFPLYVAEADSPTKLDRINRSAYLSRGLRSLSSLGGSVVVYGHSLDANDDHIFEALVRSKVKRMAFSVYGDPKSARNRAAIQTAKDLVERRAERSSRIPLAVTFFDAADVALWEPA